MINVIGEIGINHNGSVDTAKKLIDVCVVAGCSHVKFQKRTPDICVPDHQKDEIRKTPWGEITYLDYKKRIEFGSDEYDDLVEYANEKEIGFLASVWDKPSVDFMSQYGGTTKIPSALITDDELVEYARKKSDYLMVSTGMSTESEIEHMMSVGTPDLVFHTNSTYPSPIEELNLNYINWLKNKYPAVEVGYSGHEYGLVTTFAAVAMGATWVERHVTLDRTMFGSDQMASVEPIGLMKLMKGIRDIELSLGHGGPRTRTTGELLKMNTLRKVVS